MRIVGITVRARVDAFDARATSVRGEDARDAWKDGKTDGASRRARVVSIGGRWMATGASAERGRMGTDADAVAAIRARRAARRWCGSAGAERESRSVWYAQAGGGYAAPPVPPVNTGGRGRRAARRTGHRFRMPMSPTSLAAAGFGMYGGKFLNEEHRS